jgi:hypothetical protein
VLREYSFAASSYLFCGLGFGVYCLLLSVECLVFGVWGLEVKVQGLGLGFSVYSV